MVAKLKVTGHLDMKSDTDFENVDGAIFTRYFLNQALVPLIIQGDHLKVSFHFGTVVTFL